MTKTAALNLALLLCVAIAAPTQATARHPEAPPELEHWGQLAGDWECTLRSPSAEGSHTESRSTWTWRYVLSGRAVQDEYVADAAPGAEPFRGGALRIFNPETGAWEISWIDNRSPGIKHYTATSGPDHVTMRKPDGEDPAWTTRFHGISAERFSWSNEPSGATMECRRAETNTGPSPLASDR